MATMLADLATVLTNAGIANVKQGQLPDNPNACVAILEYGGVPPITTFGTPIDIDRPRVQIVSRGEPKNYDAPRAIAETAYRAMANAAPQVIASTRYLSMEPLQSPFLLGKDSNDRISFAFNVQIHKGLQA